MSINGLSSSKQIFQHVLDLLGNQCSQKKSLRRRLNRAGFILLSTTALVLFLTFNSLVLAELMLINDVISSNALKTEEAKILSQSGAEYVIASERLAHDLGLIAPPISIPTKEPYKTNGKRLRLELPDGRYFGDFAIMHFDPWQDTMVEGVLDEASKLNVNQLPLQPEYGLEARRMLQCIPGITQSLADAILDWLDEDNTPRAFGAESAYYQSLDAGIRVRNGAITDLSELLTVRGMTTELLYGNHQSSATPNPSRFHGSAKQGSGLSTYLTVYGGPLLLRENGRAKIMLNRQELPELYDELHAEFGEEVANFVVAYRMYGPSDKSQLITDRITRDGEHDTRSRAERQLGLSEGKDTAVVRNQMIVERGPLKIRSLGKYRIRSIYDLVDTQVAIPGSSEMKLVESPWDTDPNVLKETLPSLRRRVTCAGGTDFQVIVNCNTASEPVLNAVPGITNDVVKRILQLRAALGVKRGDPIEWLLTNDALSLRDMRRFAPYLTGRGSAVQFCSIGYPNGSPIVSTQSFIVDHSNNPVYAQRIRLVVPIAR